MRALLAFPKVFRIKAFSSVDVTPACSLEQYARDLARLGRPWQRRLENDP
jgi:hypothetical protein